MNAKQRRALWIGISVMIAMAMYPPWVVALRGSTMPFGYSWIFRPSNPHDTWIALDLARLFVQWIAVCLATGAAIWSFRQPR